MNLDGISLGILHSRMTSIVDEAAATLIRTAYSHIIRDAKDFAVGLLDCEGNALSQSTQSIPVFLGTMSRTSRELINACGPIAAGDVVITNDPWIGTGHLPDVNILTPVHDGVKQLGFVIVIAHMADIGGRILGTGGRELFEEGLLIPPMRLVRDGVLNETLMQIIAANVRVPQQVSGDIHSMIAATHVVSRRFIDLARESNDLDLPAVTSELQTRGHSAMRSAIRGLRSGTFYGTQHVEGLGETLTLHVRIDIDAAQEKIAVDFAGTAPQVATGHNATYGYTLAYTAYALKCLLAPGLPFTEGILRPLAVQIPLGSVLNCRAPAAVGGRHLVGQSTVPLIIGALAEAIPRGVIAESGSPRPFITVAGQRSSGRPFSIPILANGGFGARAHRDGPSAMSFPTNIEAVSTEVLESSAPLFVEEKQLLTDSGGAGRTRGGLGQRMKMRCLAPELLLSVIATHTRYPAAGIFGGGDGSPAKIAVHPSGGGVAIDGLTAGRLLVGDVLEIESPGGGGYGPPEERSLDELNADIANGYVSAEAGRAAYGICHHNSFPTPQNRST